MLKALFAAIPVSLWRQCCDMLTHIWQQDTPRPISYEYISMRGLNLSQLTMSSCSLKLRLVALKVVI